MTPEEFESTQPPEEAPVNRNIYIVPFITSQPEAPEEFNTRLRAYWQAVDKQLSQVEARAGIVNRVFHEAVTVSGDMGMKVVGQINQPAFELIKSRVDAGASLEAFDSDELFSQVIDWSRCLQVGLTNRTVAGEIQERYQKAAAERYEQMGRALDSKLRSNENGLVILSSTQEVKMPEGAEQYHIVPPELDELIRWTREYNERVQQQAQQAEAGAQASGQGQQGAQSGSGEGGGSGLWTPGSR
ncbi:MAG: hypothetical protein ACOC5K_02850 [Chloroflexota bacterium]